MSNPPSDCLSHTGSKEQSDVLMNQYIEDYLDHLCAPLLGIVPYVQRYRLRSEAQDHLLSLIEAFRDEGATPAEATALAVREYGEPYQIGQGWAEAWVETVERDSCRVRVATPLTLRAFGWFGIFTVVNFLLIERQLFWTHRDDLFPLTQLVCALSPLLAGMATGANCHPRATASICRAVLLLALCSAGISCQFLPKWDGLWFALIQCVFWLPAGCLCAGLTAFLCRQFRIQRYRAQTC